MTVATWRKWIQKLGWFICDTITNRDRFNEASNTTFLMAGIMVKRWNEEDATKHNRRLYWIEYGRYP